MTYKPKKQPQKCAQPLAYQLDKKGTYRLCNAIFGGAVADWDKLCQMEHSGKATPCEMNIQGHDFKTIERFLSSSLGASVCDACGFDYIHVIKRLKEYRRTYNPKKT